MYKYQGEPSPRPLVLLTAVDSFRKFSKTQGMKNDLHPSPRSINRRRFLAAGGFLASLPFLSSLPLAGMGRPADGPRPSRSGVNIPKEGGEYILPDLPYPANSMAPVIDQRTMEIHHGRHHAGYVNNLNRALDGKVALQSLALADLMTELAMLDPELSTALRNNGGGHYNHALFWETLSPDGGGMPEGNLLQDIENTFGSFESFKETFKRAALTRFGSGWAWLLVRPNGSLAVSSTPNQDNPLMVGLVEEIGIPILGLDVWEHAYYLHYQNRRGDYVDAWWDRVHWDRVKELYHTAKGI